MWKQMLWSRIDWEKCDETIQANSIQATVAAAIAGDVASIEGVPAACKQLSHFSLSILTL